MRPFPVSLFAVLVFVLLAFAEPSLAGPGGKIASAAFESLWGRIILGFLTVFFLPLILLTLFKEWRAERRARSDLRYMARHSALFDWLQVQQRVTDCFQRVHAAWSREDVSQAADWMTDWYWQNQQLAHLDQWAAEGLVNHCKVKKISNIKPLLFSHRNDHSPHEGSILVASITANMQDYLAERDSGKVVEGSKKFKDVETIWTFQLVDGRWLVANIEEDTMSLAYAKLIKDLPPIESTVADHLNA